MTVVAGRDEDPVGIERLDRGRDHLGDTCSGHVARRSRREGQIDRRPDPRVGTALGQRTGPRVEGRLVDRGEQDVVALVEDVLGAVAMVGIDVDDRDPFSPGRPRCRGNGHRVEETEPHRPIGGRVVSGRADDAVGRANVGTRRQLLGRGHDRAGGQ